MITESSIFTDSNAHPITLFLLCMKKLDKDWTNWVSDTISSEVHRVFGVEISRENLNKLQATKMLHSDHHDAFWEEWEIFKNVILTLNGIPPSPNIIHAPDTAMLMNGVEIANLIIKQPFKDEVAMFTAACLLYDNVHYALPPLEYCQEYITQPTYHCKDCGKKASALPPFTGVCESCAKVYEGPKPFTFKAKEDGKGHNLDIEITYDPGPIKKRFEELNKEEHPYINETGEDIQCATLIRANDYRLLKLAEFAQQVKELGLK